MRKTEGHRQKNLEKDLALADYVCREIRNGHPEALACLYEKYHPVLESFTARRVSDLEMIQDILQDFWARLLDGEDICGYQAQNQAQLRTYLIRRLNFRIMDTFRGHARHTKRFSSVDGQFREEDENSHPEGYEPKDSRGTPEENLLSRMDAKLLYTALDILSEIRPDDASLVLEVMTGKTYQEIAVVHGAVSEEDIQKTSASLRKKYTRPVTGSLARLKVILEGLIRQQGLEVRDLFQ